ncbi:MAG TPA: hypothetical protein VE685_09240 [Thermoanaerobaculia bacterium]|nr:hypothetical protein [Thermoanaerobaculia bacterium]
MKGKGGDKVFWERDNKVGRSPDFSEWTVRFEQGSLADVKPGSDPGSLYSSTSGERLVITFNDKATSSLREALRSPSPWELEHMVLNLMGQSPLANLVTVFRPTGKADPKEFETQYAALSDRIDPLWPLFYAILDALRPAKRGGKSPRRKEKPLEIWSDRYYPFGIPPSLQGHPEFDPSQEFQYEVFVFLSGDRAQIDTWKEGLLSGLASDHLESTTRAGREVVDKTWGTTVWEKPRPLTADEMADQVLRVAISSDMLKHATFMERLSAAILEDIHVDRSEFAPEELRRIVYQYHAIHQHLWRRIRLLSEFDHHLFERDLKICGGERHFSSARHMGDMLIAAAEGLEAKSEARFEKRIQFAAFSLAIITLATILMDGYNFIVGSPNEPAHPGWQNERMAFIYSVALGIAIVAVLFPIVLRGFGFRLTRRKRRLQA